MKKANEHIIIHFVLRYLFNIQT